MTLTNSAQPCTTRDFLNYLKYVEHSAENLQFFLWYREYVKRFEGANTSDLSLAMEWTQAMEDEVVTRIQKDHAENARKRSKPSAVTGVAEVFTELDKISETHKPSITSEKDPFSTPPQSPPLLQQQSAEDAVSIEESYRAQAAEAFASVGAKPPCKLSHSMPKMLPF